MITAFVFFFQRLMAAPLKLDAIRDLDLRSRAHRFVVLPGYVQSRNDGQVHYIDAQRLMELYGVPKFQCIIVDRRRPEHANGIHWALHDLIKLSPRQSGNYRLPASAKLRHRQRREFFIGATSAR